MPERRIIHIDMDAFFAAIEQRRRPEYQGKPVVVGGDGDPHKRGVVSTASYEARRYGIRSAMPLREAYRRCPQAIFLPVDYEEYSRVSEEIMAIMGEYTPLIEPVSLDEAFLDVSEIPRHAEEIARDIKDRIKKETGLTASIGIAPNKLLAKIASDLNKPDGFTVIKEDEKEKVLSDLPVRSLWGVGKKTEAYLKEMGINTVGQLAKVQLETLKEHFGNSFGQMLYDHSRGIDNSPVITEWEPKSISRETTYQRDTRDLGLIKSTLLELTVDVVRSLKSQGYKGRTVTVKIRYQGFVTVTKARTLDESTDSLDPIWKTALSLLSKFEFKKKVRLVGIRVSNLSEGPSNFA